MTGITPIRNKSRHVRENPALNYEYPPGRPRLVSGALNRFVDDGVQEIGNNILEDSIRPSALGKRNWLFIGHPDAGERSAVIYTLLGSCRRHGINPFEYLKDLFTRLPAAKITRIKEFTPAAWAKARAMEKVVAQAA